MSIAEIAACSTRPPSKYWLRYISCQMRADGEGVLADQELAVVLDGADDGLLAAGEAALAPAVDALVGLDLDEQLVADADPGRQRVDGGDLHAVPGFRRP